MGSVAEQRPQQRAGRGRDGVTGVGEDVPHPEVAGQGAAARNDQDLQSAAHAEQRHSGARSGAHQRDLGFVAGRVHVEGRHR
ncbi:MAG: hypothetical protein M3237_17345 [Actinomycetota bacterium]|nr:hypothetical protein [Actinomycetota bacterium]